MESLFNLKIDKEYKEIVEDLIKYSTIFLTINLLVFLTNPDKKLFNKNFCDLYCFFLVGLFLYWLVIRKLVLFKEK